MLTCGQWPICESEDHFLDVDGVQVKPWIAADAAYPTMECLLTPFKGTSLPPAKETFNYCLSSNRMRIENAIGIIVKRFPIMRNEFRFRDEVLVNYIIVACAILHNLCLDWDDDDFSEEDLEEILDRFRLYSRPPQNMEDEVAPVLEDYAAEEDELCATTTGVSIRNALAMFIDEQHSAGLVRFSTASELRRNIMEQRAILRTLTEGKLMV